MNSSPGIRCARREDSRMLVLHRAAQRIEHRRFADFPELPARRRSRRAERHARHSRPRLSAMTDASNCSSSRTVGGERWKCLVKPGRKMREGALVHVRGRASAWSSAIEPDGERVIDFRGPIDLDAAGELPLPPYFEREVEPADAERYQTVFARERGRRRRAHGRPALHAGDSSRGCRTPFSRCTSASAPSGPCRWMTCASTACTPSAIA